MVAPLSARPSPAARTPTHHAMLHEGSRGPSVESLQRQLNSRGAKLKVDGIFGPKTEAAVKHFQKTHNLKADGVVGDKTWGSLDRRTPRPDHSSDAQPVRKPDPRKNGKSAQWNHYADIVRKHGGQVNPGGQPTVLGLRQKNGGASSNYSDTFVVLHKNGKVEKFVGSTRPGQSSSSAATDGNRDGVGDVAMIRPGNYKAVANGSHGGMPSFHVVTKGGSGNIPTYRDLNHDGFYSASEKRYSISHGLKATEILFHVGGSNPSSIGCQNLTPGNMAAFIRSVGGSNGHFNYTLVNR